MGYVPYQLVSLPDFFHQAYHYLTKELFLTWTKMLTSGNGHPAQQKKARLQGGTLPVINGVITPISRVK